MRKTVKSVIMEVMRENPNGLGIQHLKKKVGDRWATTAGNLCSIVCQMVKRRELRRGHDKTCEECGRKYNAYYLPENDKAVQDV